MENNSETKTCTLTGTLIEAGDDDEGQPRLIINATIEELKQCSALPFYTKAEITFRWTK